MSNCGRWHPFRALRSREHITFKIHPSADLAGGGYYARAGIDVYIVVSPDMTPEERRCVVAHELVHDERRVTERAGATRATMAKEEAQVRAETARRMVPVEELAEWAWGRAEIGPVMLEDVAAEFAVTPPVALAAIRNLQEALLRGELAGDQAPQVDPRAS